LRCWHFSCTFVFVPRKIPGNPVRKADQSRRRPENVPGCFFIDEECISCGACWRLAPTFIFSHPVHTFAFFSRQPVTDRETRVAEEALLICPVGAIGTEDSA
jgi:ferredoxin